MNLFGPKRVFNPQPRIAGLFKYLYISKSPLGDLGVYSFWDDQLLIDNGKEVSVFDILIYINREIFRYA